MQFQMEVEIKLPSLNRACCEFCLFLCFVFIMHVGKSCHVLEISDFKSVAIYVRKGFIIFSFETFYAVLRSC